MLWDVRSQCRSTCSLSSMPPWHSWGTEQHPCLKGGEIPHVWCFCWDFVACVGFSLFGVVESHFLGWGCSQKTHLHKDVLGIGNQLLATALNHNLQSWVLPGLWGLASLGSGGSGAGYASP